MFIETGNDFSIAPLGAKCIALLRSLDYEGFRLYKHSAPTGAALEV